MVEPLLFGITVGSVCISVAGLFVAAIGNWALSDRLMLLGTVWLFCAARVVQNRDAVAFPAFAQQLYAFPIDATGKAVCANCHLAEAPNRISGQSAVLVDLNVGGVVVLFVSVAADSNIFTPFSAAEPNAFVFGPVPASEYATAVLSALTPYDARSLSFPVVVAGNRGEGPIYGIWTRQAAVQMSRLPAGVDILGTHECYSGAHISIDAVLATNSSVRVPERLGYYVQVVAAIAATQLALVLKKKQYERFRLGQDGRSLEKPRIWPRFNIGICKIELAARHRLLVRDLAAKLRKSPASIYDLAIRPNQK